MRAVLAVLFACFAVAVIAQTCDVKTLTYADVVNGDTFTVDAKSLTGLKGILTVTKGTGSASVEYQKGQGYNAVVTKGLVTISRTISDGASQLGGVNALVTLALAALALVSQRGSLAALAIILAIATVALAACATVNTVNVSVVVDQAVLKTFVLQVKVNPTTNACPTDVTIEGDLKAWVATSVSAGICSYTFTNQLFGCPNSCGDKTNNVAETTCVAGQCTLKCNAGFQPCNNDCETADNAVTSCGSCSNNCNTNVLNVGAASCNAGACDYDTCASGFSDCNNDRTDGCEAGTSTPAACGSCGNNCTSLPGIDTAAGVDCVSNACTFTCATGKLDCDTTAPGCEADTTADTSCGGCGNDCTVTLNTNAAAGTCNSAGASPVCAYTCNAGFADCTPALGCETSTTDPLNCGACGNNCAALPNVDPTGTSCNSGTCAITACLPGYLDCDGVASNGCEVETATNATACGTCANNCASLPNVDTTAVTCASSTCVTPCLPGFANCGTGSGVGCPDDTATSATNCGRCGNSCPGVLNAVKKCTAGACDYETCDAGFIDCNGDRTDGCETAINDKNNCGTCGNNCEVSGAAGNFISATCSASAPYTCSLTCASGFTNCDGSIANGCEINTGANISSCGTCGNVCNLPNTATYKCVTGSCQTATCAPNFAICTGAATAGCLINTQTDANNCGACFSATVATTKCSSLPNVAPGITCAAGVCQVATNCAATHNDCDANVLNGCETPVNVCTPATAGGSCNIAQGYTGTLASFVGTDCAAIATNPANNVVSATCNRDAASATPLGVCALTCATGFSDCDGRPDNGCEASNANCGSSLTPGLGCQTALKDINGAVSCAALKTDAVLNQTVTQGATTNVCNNANGQCTYTCSSNFYDCDKSAQNGCEVDKRKCPTNTDADCVFNNNTRCGSECTNCLTISGAPPGSGSCNTATLQCQFTCPLVVSQTAISGCNNTDLIASNGCEAAQFYRSVPGIDRALDCSKDIDLTNVLSTGPIICDGNSTSTSFGRCLFTCKPGFKDCDDNPLNGCETELKGSCTSCVYQADVSCGKNKCVDCTLLEGTLGSDYANGRWASASASTCLPLNATVNPRATDYVCDTSVHYLNPRFDPPDGDNGACQSELCRDLDGDWSNGCESAQQYGRGRFYYYGDSINTDAYLVPYVPNPYEDRFYDYKDAFTAFPDSAPSDLLNPIASDINILTIIRSGIISGVNLRTLIWQAGGNSLAGYASGPTSFSASNFNAYFYSAISVSGLQLSPSFLLTGRELALLHYAADDFTKVDSPAEAAAMAIMGEVYNNPVDCVLSEWSDWGLCTYQDDCIRRDYFLMTRIRTREVITPAANGGVCHLPLVEDFYRFSHRNSVGNGVSFSNPNFAGFPVFSASGADLQHGGGFAYRVDYTKSLSTAQLFNINNVELWGPEDWSFKSLWTGTFARNDPKDLAWTGNVLGQNPGDNTTADRVAGVDPYGILLTCAPFKTCPDVNQGLPKVACNITAWSEWSACSASCDGDWAGGVRIRTRTVISGASANGECFETEFDQNGLPLPLYGASAGMLYEEDWQCNDHSCASYNCNQLKDAAFAAANHIYLGADATAPQCDGRDWPEYVNGLSWVDVNRDGLDDNAQYAVRGGEIFAVGGNFPLWNTIYNFSYEYRWPGHCIYECEEGWFDCDHRPDNGCETNGDFCSIDAEFGSTTQLEHPILPWEHPHGECTIAWKHDASGVVARDCTNFNQRNPELLNTVGKCIPATGLCDLTCEAGYANCENDGCIKVDGSLGFCGSACVDCTKLNVFKYGYSAGWQCVGSAEDDYTCEPKKNTCDADCVDADGNKFNGCETASYKQWPYPEVTPTAATMDQWSAWTECTRSDDCGYLWDMSSGANVFRNVPIQTRYRRPVTSAYNGGYYPEFSLLPKDSLMIDGVAFPTQDELTAQLTLTPALKDVLGVPLVQTPFYEVRVCPTAVTPCIECTNQLQGMEQHCELSEWSKWSACSAECVDRIVDLAYYGKTELTALKYLDWDPANVYYVTNRVPYQIRTRSVTKKAAMGGRCPPPLDTWQLAEAASNTPIRTYGAGSTPDNSGIVDSFNGNSLLSAKASFLVDVRKCNTEMCQYPEDCDALNYWYPGHFSTVATCGASRAVGFTQFSGVTSMCVANTGFVSTRFSAGAYANGCNAMNGYCDSVNGDLRDGCDTFVYPTQCGRPDANGQCNYDLFFDCTELPGVTSPFAAPCVVDPATSMASGATFAEPNPADSFNHICDIRWACNATACTSETNTSRGYSRNYGGSWSEWMDGCEVARAYTYPFVTVKSNFATNPMSMFFDIVSTGSFPSQVLDSDVNNRDAEGQIVLSTFFDPSNKYNLSQTNTADNSRVFSFDCHGFLSNSMFCGDDAVKEPALPYEKVVASKVVATYAQNQGCHLSGNAESDKFDDLGFGCNGVWNTPQWGMCVMNCAAGYVDADLDPRNGCETDLFAKATPEDHYVWVGDCKANTNGGVDINTQASCGADQCVNCSALPGIVSTPGCALVEESEGKIPVLSGEEDYYAIQYACGVLNGRNSYVGFVDFANTFCDDTKCADGDMDWTNGCEQGRGYDSRTAYVLGGVYDKLFDTKNYLEAGNPACTNDATLNFYTNFASASPNVAACDARSSGFEFPVPGAWFFQNYKSLAGDTNRLGEKSWPVSDLTATTGQFWLDLATLNGLLPVAETPEVALNKRAFDCSILYSTDLMFAPVVGTATASDPFGKYRYVGRNDASAIWTFGQVHHINVSALPGGSATNVCNKNTGLCNYVCQNGWDDYDLDPSNGCEADLSGPCGAPNARREKRYENSGSCGEFCTDCNVLAGSYISPVVKTECLPVYPENFLDENKHNYVLRTVRFVHSCVTEIVKPLKAGVPGTSQTINAWRNIVCDPLSCFDADFEYDNGCELAVDYPYSWANQGKVAYNHWFSPLPPTALDAGNDALVNIAPFTGTPVKDYETYYWVRDDGVVTIGRSNTFPTIKATDAWTRVVDLKNDYAFRSWDIRSVPSFSANKWFAFDSELGAAAVEFINTTTGAAGNNVFPYNGITSAWDCSNSETPSGTYQFSLGATLKVDVDWEITTSMEGPWFHVNQSAVSQCFAGPDPGALATDYTNGNVIRTNFCTPANTNTDGGYNKQCYDTWVTLGSGKCKLACETGWADGDADPSNGCESFLANGQPYPLSSCGTYFRLRDPAADKNYPNNDYNYNNDFACGAGLCLPCASLGGVNKDASSTVANVQASVAGMKSFCVDGGADWFDEEYAAIAGYKEIAGGLAAKTGNPTFDPDTAGTVKYPSDYYCTGIINENACLRAQLPISCRGSNQVTIATDCDALQNVYPKVGGGRQATVTGSAFLKVCADVDDAWETGCEVALGYNLNVDTRSPVGLFPGSTDVPASVSGSITLRGIYKRSIGVKPYYDGNFTVIDWSADLPAAGFDCEILRYLPQAHTHIVPQTSATVGVIECSKNFRNVPGLCSFTCQPGWVDCDQNPWNGCEQSDLLCGGSAQGAAGCELAQRYSRVISCASINLAAEIDRSTFCDGNQLPYDDWHIYYDTTTASKNTNDASQYDDMFEIRDNGIDYVNVMTASVDPLVSRYTIKGYWDNVDIDYSCRVWLSQSGLRSDIPADANYATGRCAVDCKESTGYSDCDGDALNGCEGHNTVGNCRTTSGACMSCSDIPGIVPLRSDCLATKLVSGNTVNFDSITTNWAVAAGVEAGPYVVTYGTAASTNAISNEFPQCDTRGVTNAGVTNATAACDDNLCRDYDGDWENGCEFPMNYRQVDRDNWETPSALYTAPSVTVVDGFDCSWISDPQPDAGGRNYGGKTWAQKYHVNTNRSAGGRLGHCVGVQGRVNSGKCDIVCEAGWSDCDGDPSNGCENDDRLCASCVFALGYPDNTPVNCSSLTDASKGFVPFRAPNLPTCNGREGQDGQCSYYFCNIFDGFCDSGLGATLNGIGCINLTSSASNTYCGADWNWRDIRGNMSTVTYSTIATDYEGGRMLDYSNFDGTGRCATCGDLNGFVGDAVCEKDPIDAARTNDKVTYYKPAASGWIDNSLGQIMFNTAGNTVGDYLCQLHGKIGMADDGACDRNLCVDEDFYWANGCETAVNYPASLLAMGEAGPLRQLSTGGADFGFDYHFAYNDDVFGRNWPYNAAINGQQTSGSKRSEVRGIWCPFLQFWSLSTDNYVTGDCDVFPCPHFDISTVTSWITCVNNASLADAGKCNFKCNLEDGWKDCDANPLTGCETDIFNDGTCGSNCERVECNSLDGLNPNYWSECVQTGAVSKCDLSICESSLCVDKDNDWTNGCETATNYPGTEEYNCRALMAPAEMARLHLAHVDPCNGEVGHHMAGKCDFTCEPGWVDCDGLFSNGCEHDGSLCQDCTKALGYVTNFDGADWWEFWGAANDVNDRFYSVVYGSKFTQNTRDLSYGMVNNSFSDYRGILHDQFDGPNVAYSKYHHAFVAAFDCSELRSTYPGHFTDAAITCDSSLASPTAGRCVYACNAANGYFDCDGDPRNGCEHLSQHSACGEAGACRNCYYISGVDYPVDADNNGLNDGSMGPYTTGAFNVATSADVIGEPLPVRTFGDVYAEPNARYFGIYTLALLKNQPTPNTSPLRLGCTLDPVSLQFGCNLDTCVTTVQGFQPCKNDNQASKAGWKDGCEVAYGYNFGPNAADKIFDCSRMGPDAGNGDLPRPTNIPGTPSFHVRQVVGTFGCDAQQVNDTASPYIGRGAWRYILARLGRSSTAENNQTSGIYAFDYQGLENFFMINDDLSLGETLSDLDSTVSDFVLYRVRGSDRIGTCYYECEYGYEDCNGDPRDGCEIKTSACIDTDGRIGWDWTNGVATNGCETALGYTGAQLRQTGSGPFTFNCLNLQANGLNVNISEPFYCRGGQDGNLAQLGTCQFTCNAGFQDCNGNPADGCEATIGDNSCNCVSCIDYLPGTRAQSNDPLATLYSRSQSTCNLATNQCTLPCDETLCKDEDGDWTNGCETAMAYLQPRVNSSEFTTPITTFDCSSWAKSPLLAKKHHIDPLLLDQIFCEGRSASGSRGTCSFQGACLKRANGGINNWQDCNSDPRDGCEDSGRWCVLGAAETGPAPRGTKSDLCSKAQRYLCVNGFNALDQQCDSTLVTANSPSFDCENLFRTVDALDIYHIDNSSAATVPYCDRDATNLATRGDCVVKCAAGWADCDKNIAKNGCEANISLDATCNKDCVNCNILPGIDTRVPPKCIPDPLNAGSYKCDYICIAGAGSTSCADVDGEWQNGCEVALNNDRDKEAVFMNLNDNMDCSVMQDEAKKNPELFRHHLHIDLDASIVLAAGTMPPGSIFCNSASSTFTFGKCLFACIPGFVNADREAWNGCEAPDTTSYNGATQLTYGGFLIGDYKAEKYIQFLKGLQAANTLPITYPRNLPLMGTKASLLYAPSFEQVIWY